MVRLAVSAGVTVPSVIGWLKPVILIPPSTIAGLTPKQMELILAHELAHICRQDYFWNLLQVAVETLLFYHPVVGWISGQARMERELCCDDMVVGSHGNAVAYARALTELESLRHPHKALLMGADGGQMFNRIHRLAGPAYPGNAGFLAAAAGHINFAAGRHHHPIHPPATGVATLARSQIHPNGQCRRAPCIGAGACAGCFHRRPACCVGLHATAASAEIHPHTCACQHAACAAFRPIRAVARTCAAGGNHSSRQEPK